MGRLTPFQTLCRYRWPNGVCCPHCGHKTVYELRGRHRFTCASKLCRRQFSPTTGTQFRYRKMAPEQYVKAIDCFPQCSSPADMQRALKVDYRTAFKLFHGLKASGGKFI